MNADDITEADNVNDLSSFIELDHGHSTLLHRLAEPRRGKKGRDLREVMHELIRVAAIKAGVLTAEENKLLKAGNE